MTTERLAPPPVRSADAVRTWAPIVALSLGIMTLVASEFLPASVLPTMAADIGVREGVAGLAVAATAAAGALTAPTITVVLPRADRRNVLIGLLIAATVSNVVVAVTPSFAVLLVGRLILGVAIAGYWSLAFGAGVSTRPGRDHVVSTSLSVGVSVATIVAVPLASLAGDAIGWRAVFVGAAVAQRPERRRGRGHASLGAGPPHRRAEDDEAGAGEQDADGGRRLRGPGRLRQLRGVPLHPAGDRRRCPARGRVAAARLGCRWPGRQSRSGCPVIEARRCRRWSSRAPRLSDWRSAPLLRRCRSSSSGSSCGVSGST